MERKIGEIFEFDCEWYQCVKGNFCSDCAFAKKHCNVNPLFEFEAIGCCDYRRKDAASVIFKKLKKVGKPYEHYEKFYQCYKLPMETEIRLLPNNCYPIGKDNLVEIEIKHKEDMEEKKIKLSQDDIDCLKKQIRWAALPGYITHEEDYDRATEEIMNLFIPSDTEHSSSEKIGKNLKPFDLEAAKAGKPVCTRDGRKARILCYDFKQNEEYPILVAVENKDGKEFALLYSNDGISEMYKSRNNELVMLPEKKEGWVNVYNHLGVITLSHNPFDTKEEALEGLKSVSGRAYCVDTIKINWEE